MTHCNPQGAKRLTDSSNRDSEAKAVFLTQQDQAVAYNPEGLATKQALSMHSDVFPLSGNSNPSLTNLVKCLIFRKNLMRTPMLWHYLQDRLQTSLREGYCFHISKKYLGASVTERTWCLHLEPS